MSLEGKVALITGAGSGFGEGMAKRFAKGGAKVVIVDRDKAGAERVAGEIGDAALAVAADISKEADVDAAVEAALSKFGKVDILVNNAGIGHKPQNAELVEPEEFDRIVGVNVRGVYLMTRKLIPHFKENGAKGQECVILNVASISRAPAPESRLVQCNQGLGCFGDEGAGHRACTGKDLRGGAEPGGG